ncbi:hypothetical protein FHW96_003340 [Novosphingobium sp. SG751A]|nr:hypothetical protein [Novosphingobium sp. SG751A]
MSGVRIVPLSKKNAGAGLNPPRLSCSLSAGSQRRLSATPKMRGSLYTPAI